jgi:hypothetical protein
VRRNATSCAPSVGAGMMKRSCVLPLEHSVPHWRRLRNGLQRAAFGQPLVASHTRQTACSNLSVLLGFDHYPLTPGRAPSCISVMRI